MEKYFKILGINFTTDKDLIKKTYRELVKTNHPDKGGSEDRFKEILEAYNKLMEADLNPKSSFVNDDLSLNKRYGKKKINVNKTLDIDIVNYLNERTIRTNIKYSIDNMTMELPLSVHLKKDKSIYKFNLSDKFHNRVDIEFKINIIPYEDDFCFIYDLEDKTKLSFYRSVFKDKPSWVSPLKNISFYKDVQNKPIVYPNKGINNKDLVVEVINNTSNSIVAEDLFGSLLLILVTFVLLGELYLFYKS